MQWFAPYTIFGETRSARVEVWLNGEIIPSNTWDEELWFEDSKHIPDVLSSFKNKRVRVVRREEWLRSQIIPTSESTPHEDQLQFFHDAILGELEWCDEFEEAGINHLSYAINEIKKMRKEINRLSGVATARFQANGGRGGG